MIKQGKAPKEIIQAAFLNHPGVKKSLQVVCDNQLLQKIPFVATACKFINENAAEIEATPVAQTRGLLGSLVDKVTGDILGKVVAGAFGG